MNNNNKCKECGKVLERGHEFGTEALSAGFAAYNAKINEGIRKLNNIYSAGFINLMAENGVKFSEDQKELIKSIGNQAL